MYIRTQRALAVGVSELSYVSKAIKKLENDWDLNNDLGEK